MISVIGGVNLDHILLLIT